MSWIQTYSGVQFWPLEPRVEDVRLEDIAHALANHCRFNGHCRTFYSVAQHSVLVSEELRLEGFEDDTLAAALFHDAAEAYLPDICRPIKSAWPDFPAIERRLLNVILQALGIGGREPDQQRAIKRCDDMQLATEARDLLGPPPAPWISLPAPSARVIIPWSPGQSKRKFLKAACRLEQK